MKHQHYLRNFGLLGIGAIGLAILVPQIGDTGGAPSSQRSSFAASPKLVNYLEAQLQTRSTRTVAGAREPSLGDTLSRSPAVVESSTVAAPMAKDPAVEPEFDRYSSTALNVRARPDRTLAKLFVLQPGALVKIDRTCGKWAKIFTADGKSGWVYGSYFTAADADQPRVAQGDHPLSVAVAAPPAAAVAVDEKPTLSADDDQLGVFTGRGPDPKWTSKKSKAFLLANDTVMRTSPSKRSRKLSVIEGGSKLLVDEWKGSWARVVLSDGRSGWINAL